MLLEIKQHCHNAQGHMPYMYSSGQAMNLVAFEYLLILVSLVLLDMLSHMTALWEENDRKLCVVVMKGIIRLLRRLYVVNFEYNLANKVMEVLIYLNCHCFHAHGRKRRWNGFHG